ncbi:hypothetical protein CAL12_24445 [Bordetella genomosp. 8]|uniref:Uncharacterized protein n=1 Tax=Bordetella genomosp. 8 TaxID=1416806 RepID=A0A1W6YRV4_9BORD|nr:hypothetical protein [Bordetella genomosp. 8]ARP83649.1 hypothetical protein CAL12_24445 [Bordetella genomosp. 8]
MNPHKILTAVGVAGMAYMAIAMSMSPSHEPATASVVAQAATEKADDVTLGPPHGTMTNWVRDMIMVAVRGAGL